MWPFDSSPQLGTPGNPSNYNTGPNSGGFGGPGEIMGGGQVPLGKVNLPYFQQDRDRLQGLLGGQSPFASGDWQSLLDQLKARASGAPGTSQAANAFAQGLGQTQGALQSMAAGSNNPEAARQAMMQMGKTGQGLSQGMANATLQESQMAQGQLQQALGARDQLNQNAYLNILAQQLGLSEGQLRALQGDQSFAQGQQQVDANRDAAKLQALTSLLAGIAKAGG